ncbi:MAG TPA: LysE family translocator [Frankiaceae bacterium]|nr:LysE family translocator [Frankiaceae bacterium]
MHAAFLPFTAAAILIVLLPGPDTLVVVRNILFGGRRQGAMTALGNVCGLAIWVGVATFGLAAALRASQVGYDILRIVGATYLVWLGISALRTRRAGMEITPGRRGLLGNGFSAGILTNLLNPKVGVFFVSFLPGFIPRQHGVAAASLLLGGIFLVLTAIYWVVLLALAGKVTAWLNRPAVRRRLSVITGVVLVGFGVRLATES